MEKGGIRKTTSDPTIVPLLENPSRDPIRDVSDVRKRDRSSSLTQSSPSTDDIAMIPEEIFLLLLRLYKS